MADIKAKFDIFGSVTKDDIRVGYISTDRGYVQSVTICEANEYAKKNPQTIFIYENRDKVLYLDINQVNQIDPSILLPEKTGDSCTGLEIDTHECDPKSKAYFYGGGGVGVVGNPIIGKDGAILAIDIIQGGFGYQYPPVVEVKNDCGIGDGSLFRSVLSDEGYTVNTLTYYDECGLDEDYDICAENDVKKAGYGRLFDRGGKDIGPWDPTKYTDNILADPIDLELEAYEKALAEFKNPFWTSRSNTPITITSGDKITKLKYDVYGWWWGSNPKVNPKGEIDNLYIKLFGRRGEPSGIEYWENDRVYGSSLERIEQGMKLQPEWKQVCEGECKPNMPDVTYLFGQYYEYDKDNFMNKNAISPLPMSNVLGTDGGLEAHSIEWDIDFPYDGDYTFIVQCDNKGTLFVDGKKQASYKLGDGGAGGAVLSPPKKNVVKIKEGSHSVRFDLVNNAERKKVVKQQDNTVKTNTVDFKTSFATLHGATASIVDLDIYHEKKFGGDYVPPQDFNRTVEYDRVYDVVLTSNTFRSEKIGTTNQITYVGLKKPENKRWSSSTRLEFDDDPKNGFDVNGSFTIDNVVGGTAKFNTSGQSIDFTGKNVKVTLTYTWKDNPKIAGKALDQIKMGGVTWTQSSENDNGEFKYVKPDGTLSITDGKQNPWFPIGAYPYVYPSNTDPLTDRWHIGDWYININAPGTYTLEARADDRCKASWDGDELFGRTKERTVTIANISTGIHKLSAGVWNMGRYGSSFSRNPGSLRWYLKDSNGNVVADSRDPFNDPGYPLRGVQGSETHTITLGGVLELGSDASGSVKLRTKGENVLQMEDIPHVGIEEQKILFDDVILMASQGRFFGINGNKAKYVLDAPLPVDRASSDSSNTKNVFDTLSFIDNATRELWKTNNLSPQARKDSANSFSNRYGITPFNPTIQHDSNYPGVHTIVWPNVKFPADAEYDITIAVDDNVRLKIGDQVDITKQGFAFGDEATTYSSFTSAGAAVGKGKFRSTGTTVYRKKVKEGTYDIVAELEQIPGGKYGMSANAMLLAIDIQTTYTASDEIVKKSWLQNPLAVALAIEAPPPPPPVREIPDVGEGCPQNPIWSTMTPGSSEAWYPANHKPWSSFTNKYALSPVPPLDTPGSDGAGAVYSTSWKMSAPYAGYYTLKGTVEDIGRVVIDGNDYTSIGGPLDKCKTIPSTKIYLSEGTHDIKVVVENKKDYETPKFFIDQKVFNTQDWQNQVSRTLGRTKDIDFKIATASWHGSSTSIEELGIYVEKAYGPDQDVTENFLRTVEYGRVYDVVLTSNTFRTITSNASGQIAYVGMKPENKRRSSGTRLEFDDDPKNGFDVNGSFTIDNVVGGTAKFNQSGDNIDITGKNVEVTLTYTWKDNPNIAGKALDLIKIGSTTWTQSSENDNGEFKYVKPDGTLSITDGKQNPWFPIGAYPYVYPSNTDPLTDRWHIGDWYININAPGTYTLEARADDRCKASWDGDELFGRSKQNSATINNVTAGIHKLSAGVWNMSKYGNTFARNPGSLRWFLKDSDGNVVADSRDPFNDQGLPRRALQGSETHTITFNMSSDLGDDMTSGIELRTKGENVLLMEDVPDTEYGGGGVGVYFDDVIMTASEGKFFGINGNKAKFVLPELHNTNLDRGGVTYKGPALYNYKFKGYGQFLNKNGVSPDYPKFGGGEIINYEWSNVDFPKNGEYDFHFAHDAHGSVYLDGKEVIKGDFDNKEGVSAQDSANWDPGIIRKIEVSKGKHTITVAPAGQTTFGANRIESERYGWTDGLFKKISDDYYRGQQAFDNNPSALALGITIKTETAPAFGSKEEIAQRGKSWKDNPTAISAILVPPPCPKKIKGKGVVVDVIVDDPGGPYPTDERPPEISYPVTLRLKKVLVPVPGINYDPGPGGCTFPPFTDPPPTTPPPGFPPPVSPPPTTVTITAVPPTIKKGECTILKYTSLGNTKLVITPVVGEVPAVPEGTVRVCPEESTTYCITGDGGDTACTPVTVIGGEDPDPEIPEEGGDKIVVSPPNGSKLRPVIGAHGTVVGVEIIDPGLGFTEYPTISMPSDTGVGVVFAPQFEIIRDPLDITPDKLIQVTDLVGLKQTGYVDGRAYYGAVFYKNDIKYAGLYETAGQLIRIYDTLQDSIDAQSTTDPSAIQRQGTDISSNDPRLDIPNTPDNLI